MRKLLVVIALVAMSAFVAGAVRAADSYVDPARDSGAAPDITGVAVTNDAAGNVALTVRTNQPALAPGAAVSVVLDSDSNLATGSSGLDHVFTVVAGGWRLLRWDGSQFVGATAPSANATYVDGVATFKVNRADLQIGTNFSFAAFTLALDANQQLAGTDVAPDANVPYTYILSFPIVLRAGAPAAVPKKPAAGKPFQVRVRISQGENGTPVASGAAACNVTLGGKALRASARFANGLATCTMRLPATARAKTLRGTVKVTVGDASISKAFSYRVP